MRDALELHHYTNSLSDKILDQSKYSIRQKRKRSGPGYGGGGEKGEHNQREELLGEPGVDTNRLSSQHEESREAEGRVRSRGQDGKG